MRFARAASAAVLCVIAGVIAACSAKSARLDPTAEPAADPGAGDPDAAPATAPPAKPLARDGGPDATPPVSGGACDLARSGLSFPGACMTCMQSKCCGPTVACFGGTSTDCTDLHACLKACAANPDAGGAGDGGGGGRGDGGGGGCAKACTDKHPGSVTAEHDYDTCLLTGCKTDCPQ